MFEVVLESLGQLCGENDSSVFTKKNNHHGTLPKWCLNVGKVQYLNLTL